MFDTGMQKKKSEKERKKIIFSFAPRPQFLQRKIFHMVRTHGQAEEFSQMQVVFVKQSLVAKKNDVIVPVFSSGTLFSFKVAFMGFTVCSRIMLRILYFRNFSAENSHR